MKTAEAIWFDILKEQPLDGSIDEYHDNIIFAIVSLLEKRKGHIYLLKALKRMLCEYGKTGLPTVLIEGIGPYPMSIGVCPIAILNAFERHVRKLL